MNKDLLLNSFKEHQIFSYFWDDSILEYFACGMKLDLKPDLYISYYQKIFEMPLNNISNSDELRETNANLKLTLTSMKNRILDIDKAILDIDTLRPDYAIMVNVEIIDKNKEKIFATQFNLGSREGEIINANSKYLKAFSFLY